MPLEVIGAGYARTGTKSLKLALEQLGYGPCHHMSEVFQNPHLMPLWGQAFDGTLGDLEEIFKDYNSTTDQPACMMWDALAERYPDAKVILTVRDPGKWFASMSATILARSRTLGSTENQTPEARKEIEAFIRMVGKTDAYHSRRLGLASRAAPPPGESLPPQRSREEMLARFNAHNEWVKRACPPERLLVFEVSQGWEPLCTFLGNPIPSTPFPRTNDADEWRSNAAMRPGGRANEQR
jgi:Sulfotransferase domain